MAFVKTRIWRGGVAGKEASQVGSESSAATLEGETLEPALPSEPTTEELARWELAAQRRARPDVLPGFESHAPQHPLATTRFMPIEQLFPEQRAALQEARQAGSRPVPSRARALLRKTRSHATTFVTWPRRWSLVRRATFALSVALVVLATRLAFSSTGREIIAERAVAAHAVPSRQPTRPAADPAARMAVPPTRKPALEASPTRSSASRDTRAPFHEPGLERAAIDALIAGDLKRAQALYARLAAGAPTTAVYQEALRIIGVQLSGGTSL